MNDNIFLKTIDHRILHFFNKNGLCVRDLNKANNGYKVLIDSEIYDFDAIETGENDVVLVCQDNEGSIIFLKEDGDEWIKTVLLNSKSRMPYDKNFKLLATRRITNLLYVLEYKGEKMLAHQILGVDEVPNIIDSLVNKEYYAFTNSSYDLVAIYNSSYYESKLGMKIFKWSQKQWFDFSIIDDGYFVSAIHDKDDNIYIILLRNNEYILKVMEKDPYSYQYDEREFSLSSLYSKISNPVLICEQDKIWILYSNEQDIFALYIEKLGEYFSENIRFIKKSADNNRIYKLRIKDYDYIIDRCIGYMEHNMPSFYVYHSLFDFNKRFDFSNPDETEIEQFAGIERETDAYSDEFILENKKKLDKEKKEKELPFEFEDFFKDELEKVNEKIKKLEDEIWMIKQIK